jgi:hypothetical protein
MALMHAFYFGGATVEEVDGKVMELSPLSFRTALPIHVAGLKLGARILSLTIPTNTSTTPALLIDPVLCNDRCQATATLALEDRELLKEEAKGVHAVAAALSAAAQQLNQLFLEVRDVMRHSAATKQERVLAKRRLTQRIVQLVHSTSLPTLGARHLTSPAAVVALTRTIVFGLLSIRRAANITNHPELCRDARRHITKRTARALQAWVHAQGAEAEARWVSDHLRLPSEWPHNQLAFLAGVLATWCHWMHTGRRVLLVVERQCTATSWPVLPAAAAAASPPGGEGVNAESLKDSFPSSVSSSSLLSEVDSSLELSSSSLSLVFSDTSDISTDRSSTDSSSDLETSATFGEGPAERLSATTAHQLVYSLHARASRRCEQRDVATLLTEESYSSLPHSDPLPPAAAPSGEGERAQGEVVISASSQCDGCEASTRGDPCSRCLEWLSELRHTPLERNFFPNALQHRQASGESRDGPSHALLRETLKLDAHTTARLLATPLFNVHHVYYSVSGAVEWKRGQGDSP